MTAVNTAYTDAQFAQALWTAMAQVYAAVGSSGTPVPAITATNPGTGNSVTVGPFELGSNVLAPVFTG